MCLYKAVSLHARSLRVYSVVPPQITSQPST